MSFSRGCGGWVGGFLPDVMDMLLGCGRCEELLHSSSPKLLVFICILTETTETCRLGPRAVTQAGPKVLSYLGTVPALASHSLVFAY